MKNLLLTLLFIGSSTFKTTNTEVDKIDKSFAINYLQSTLIELENDVKNLSEEELNYKPKNGGWSIMNCLEHIASTEPAIIEGAKKVMKKKEIDSTKDLSGNDGIVISNVTNRGNKVKTPEAFEPTNKFKTLEEVMNTIRENRASTISLLKKTDADLRHLFGKYPYGDVDVYQLFIVSGAHGYRHTLQIRSIIEEMKKMNE